MAPEDPSNLGLKPTDARRSMDHLFGLAPSADWSVEGRGKKGGWKASPHETSIVIAAFAVPKSGPVLSAFQSSFQPSPRQPQQQTLYPGPLSHG